MSSEPTIEEMQAIRALVRLGRRWPASLGLLSMSGSLHVVRLNEDGGFIHKGDALDPDAVLATIKGISNDGGDW